MNKFYLFCFYFVRFLLIFSYRNNLLLHFDCTTSYRLSLYKFLRILKRHGYFSRLAFKVSIHFKQINEYAFEMIFQVFRPIDSFHVEIKQMLILFVQPTPHFLNVVISISPVSNRKIFKRFCSFASFIVQFSYAEIDNII